MSLIRCLPILLVLLLSGCQTLDLPGLVNSTGGLSPETAAAGLREALSVGTQNAVGKLSSPGGFAKDVALRLATPPALKDAASTLRKVGMGSLVDTLEDRMNVAAEQAVAQAAPVFVDAIKAMTIQDALGLVNGGPNAATNYFRKHTESALAAKFKPIINTEIQKVGALKAYGDLVQSYNAIPLTKKVNLNLDDYVLNQSMNGLFSTLAKEEGKIRADPVARTSELLRQVFGK
jgi:hypothetical protein